MLSTCTLLAALTTMLVFATACENGFVALDDYAYIVHNPNIKETGWHTVVWALTSFYEGNWHPLTMLSLAVDFRLWGLSPTGYHLANAAIHSMTVFFTCLLAAQILKAVFRYEAIPAGTVRRYAAGNRLCLLQDSDIALGSLASALFFGLHPLRVESVVWASERKDVLCMLFLSMSLWMYLKYADSRGSDSTKAFWKYREYRYSLALAVLALMSKPTAVSLPLILCILDWYPLQRIPDRQAVIRMLVEKTPFFILSVIGAVLTFLAQQVAMRHAPDVGMASRLLVACKALLFYLVKTVWPSGLTAFYMHPGEVAGAGFSEYHFYALLVIALCLAVLLAAKTSRLWAALWLIYVISLLPMIGIVQVGGQWVADRYSYLPSLAVSMLWGGGIACLVSRMQAGGHVVAKRLVLILFAGQLLAYTLVTLKQITVWRNTETLATRIIEQMPHISGAPYMARAIYRKEAGRNQEALADIGEAMKIALRNGATRTYPGIAFEQAVILKNLRRYAEALATLDWGIRMSAGTAPADAFTLREEIVLLDAGKRPGM